MGITVLCHSNNSVRPQPRVFGALKMSHPGVCFICCESLSDGSPTRVIKQKGINTFITKSKLMEDNKWQNLARLTEVRVHEQCRINYSVSKKKRTVEVSPPSPVAEEEIFDFETNCFLCGEAWAHKRKLGRVVATVQLQEYIKESLRIRDDEWAHKVDKRINSVSLKDVHARYHAICYDQFRNTSKRKSIGE